MSKPFRFIGDILVYRTFIGYTTIISLMASFVMLGNVISINLVREEESKSEESFKAEGKS